MLATAALILASLAGAGGQSDPASVRCEATKSGGMGLDLTGYPQESASNRGAASSVQVKTYQEAFVASFDLSELRGRRVLNATPHVRMSQGALLVADVCTISADGWPEGTGSGRAQAKEGESSYLWMRAPGAGSPPNMSSYWAGYVGSTFGDVTFANGGSLCSYAHHTNISRSDDGWTSIGVEPVVVEAMALDQDGLTLCDSSQLHNNTAVSTRQQGGAKPWLEVQAENFRQAPPAAAVVAELSASPGEWNGEATLVWTSNPAATFGFDVRWSTATDAFSASSFDSLPEAHTVPRAQIPRPSTNGAPTRLWLQDLPAGQTVKVGVRPYAYGAPRDATPPTFVVIDLPKARAPKVFAKSPWPQLQPAPMLGVPSLVGVFATEEYVKVSPVTGNRLEGGHYNDKTHSDGSWKNANTVFGATSGSDQQASLVFRAAKGEVVQAQLFVENKQPTGVLRVAGIRFEEASGWSGSGLGHPELGRLWYARSDSAANGDSGEFFSSAVVPMGERVFGRGAFDIPSTDNPVPGQTNAGLWLSLFVPLDVAAGTYSGQLVISVAGGEASGETHRVSVPLSLSVLDVSLPAAPSFALDLNSYSDSIEDNCGASVGHEQCELLTHQLAHAHRHTANTLCYGQTGKLDEPYAPPLTGQGAATTIKSWDAFDARLGKFFSGAAFSLAHGYNASTRPGGGVPVSDFYLPFFEDFPSNLSAVYSPSGLFDLFQSNREPPHLCECCSVASRCPLPSRPQPHSCSCATTGLCLHSSQCQQF